MVQVRPDQEGRSPGVHHDRVAPVPGDWFRTKVVFNISKLLSDYRRSLGSTARKRALEPWVPELLAATHRWWPLGELDPRNRRCRGGDRDSGKRPHMGRAAERLADRVVITSDNPRGESPVDIIAGIVAGLVDANHATIIEDRAAAIAWAIEAAVPGDVILVAGKGHENYQLIGDERRDFSDFGVASAALAALQEVSA